MAATYLSNSLEELTSETLTLPFVNFFPITPFFLRVKKIGTLSNEIITLPYNSPCLRLCGLKRIGKSKDN